MQRPKVVIIGGGFAGISAARALRGNEVDVVVIDRTNHHLFQPLLYQVATATLAPSDIAVPIRWILRRYENVRVVMGEVTGIDVGSRQVLLEHGARHESYDYLIVAAGARHAYFGHDEWEPNAPGLKSLDDALEIRHRFLQAFEDAEKCEDPAEREALQTIVIIGGGPTGVELAGLMATIARDVMHDDFRRIDTRRTRVILLEGGDRILPAFPAHLSEEALRDVAELGVEIRLNSIVTRIDNDAVYIGDQRIATRTVFWAAGNAASPLGTLLGAPTDRAGRVQVAPDLSVPGRSEIFVVGDLAAVTREDGRAVPAVAPAANQEGSCAAKNILRTVRHQPRLPFRYFNKGDLATIGRHRAVADFGSVDFTGIPAWLLWLFVHIMYLVGFRNRVTVLIQWAWAYFAYQRGSRLITGGAFRGRRRAGRWLAVLLLAPSTALAQWTNRYPRNAGYGHQVYLEGYELPILTSGVHDAAESGSGALVVAARGWLWRLDTATGVARRLTTGRGVDSRPAWSPDGRRLAWVRDDTRTLAVVVRDLETGREEEVDRGMAMDPSFTPDGAALLYSNVSAGGDLDLYRYDFAARSKTRLTQEAGLELKPQLTPDGSRLLYLFKGRANDQVRLRTLADGKEVVLLQGNIVSQTRPALSPDGRLVAYTWPATNGWELRLTSTERPGVSLALVSAPEGRPFVPAWSADGAWLYFSEGDTRQVPQLYRVRAVGGPVEPVLVRAWEHGAPMGRLVIRTSCPACAPPTGRGADGDRRGSARLAVTDAAGHPLVPNDRMPHFEGQNGRTFFYSPGTVALDIPAGTVTVRAVRGLATPEATATLTVRPGETATATLTLTPLWQAQQAGWFSADHHFHLNYGGQVALRPTDLSPLLAGEDLDVATPMLANLHNRFEDQSLFGWRDLGAGPQVQWAQEVRSHFLGHVGLLGTRSLFWPWVWGPGYEVFGRDDRLNAEPLAHARREGGAGYYVHPVSGTRDPFTARDIDRLPVALVADAVHGNIDLLEIVCLWSNAVGTTELWYRLLNAGFPVAPSGGTDVMLDLHRTMAVGTTRVYVRPRGTFTWESYFAALKAGRSFVTTGPMVQLTVDGMLPGDVVAPSRELPFSLTVATAVPVDSVALVVNGQTVWAGLAPDSTGVRSYRGTVRVPAGGWVAARVVGPAIDRWPAMAEYAFAHTAPIWIARVGSTDSTARRAAAADLSRALTSAERRLEAAYAGSEIPRLRRFFADARATLERLAR